MNKDYSFTTIPCDSLLVEECPEQLHFLIPEDIDTTLAASIKRFGILVPPLVTPCRNSQYLLLSGVADALAAQQAGMASITCRALAVDTPAYHRFTLQTLHLHLQGQPSVVEQSFLLSRAREHLSDQELCSLLPLMGIKPSQFKVDSMLNLMQLDPLILQAIHQGEVSLKTVSRLTSLDKGDQDELIELIKTYRLGGSKQLKLADMSVELVKREQASLKTIVSDWRQQAALRDKDNLPQQAAALLTYLYRRCHPLITAAEDDFKQLSQSLQLPDSTRLSHSQAFEDDEVELCIRFAGKESLVACWEKIKDIV